MSRQLTPVQRIESRVMRARQSHAQKARQRARAYGRERAELIRLDEIRTRDNQWCYLCDSFVNLEDSTLDHVVPLTRGGEHNAENIKLAHRTCNSIKGARLLSEVDPSEFCR